MTIAELLRNHADFATREGGMYYSGEYLSRIAKTAESLEAENAKLRELVVEVFKCARRGAACETCKVNNDGYACVYIMRELGVEVD